MQAFFRAISGPQPATRLRALSRSIALSPGGAAKETIDMATESRPDHLTATAEHAREPGLFGCRIASVAPANASGSVRLLRIDVVSSPQPLKYSAGQWLDCFLPGVSVVGGYSFVSAQRAHPALNAIAPDLSPADPSTRFSLAVKRSKHAPAAWCHSQDCKEGAELSVRVGGNFTLSSANVERGQNLKEGLQSIVMVAGGVGINPILSFITSLSVHYIAKEGSTGSLPAITLLYSARDRAEAIFLKELSALAQRKDIFGGLFTLKVFLTQDGDATAEEVFGESVGGGAHFDLIAGRRIGPLDLSQAIREGKEKYRMHASPGGQTAAASEFSCGCGSSATAMRTLPDERGETARKRDLELATDGVRVLICGPPSMTDELTRVSTDELGLDGRTQVHSEKWW
jgi:Ferric reductase NAD binding domain